MSPPDVSVIVCTHGRPALLREALASLGRQTLPRERFEVVVVENGDGEGEAVARREGADRVVSEPRLGVSRSRNAALRAVRAPLVAFLDDDAQAAPEWLECVLAVFASEPGAIAVGGPILPLYERTPPQWFLDRYEERSWGGAQRHLRPGEGFSASNFAIVKAVLVSEGGFDERLGPIGDRVGVGDETDLFERLWRRAQDPVMIYAPSAVVRHLVAAEKMAVRYQLRRAAAAGDAWATRQQFGPVRRLRTIAADAVVASVLLLRAVTRFRWPLQQWAVEELAPVAGRLGSARGALR